MLHMYFISHFFTRTDFGEPILFNAFRLGRNSEGTTSLDLKFERPYDLYGDRRVYCLRQEIQSTMFCPSFRWFRKEIFKEILHRIHPF